MEVMKCMWTVSVKADAEEFPQHIVKLRRDVGISPIYDLVFTVRGSEGVKYKPVTKKVIPVSAQDPEVAIPVYRDIPIRELSVLPVLPKQMEDLRFMGQLTKERVSSIISKIPMGFLMKAEAGLLIHILFKYE